MRRTCILLFLAATACLNDSSAQTSAGVSGLILDSSRASMPDTQVTITNSDTGAKRETTTNETGLYQFTLLQPGRYSIEAKRQGFKRVTRDGIQLEVNQAARIDFVLEPGAVTETIQVEASAPLLESNTSSVGQVIEQKAVSDLPLNGRNFAQPAVLGPGVVGVGYAASGTIGSGTRPDD